MKALAMNRIVLMVVTALATNAGQYLMTAQPAVYGAFCTGVA